MGFRDPIAFMVRKRLKVLDLESGLGGWSEAFLQRGHNVTRVDLDKKFKSVPRTLIQDFRNLEASSWRDVDVLLRAPPCGRFSVTNIGENWTTDHEPKNRKAWEAYQLVIDGLRFIERTRPRFWWMENPRAKLRRLMERDYPTIPRVTITQCQYGKEPPRQKPTDLWGKWPDTWRPRPTCGRGADCHEAQPRGSSAGSQGGGTDGAKIPYGLSLEVCLAVEEALGILPFRSARRAGKGRGTSTGKATTRTVRKGL